MTPRISVVIETFNAKPEGEITPAQAFGSLAAQDYPAEAVEMLVVCAKDTAETQARAVRPLLGRFAPSARFVEIPEISYQGAKREGLRLAAAPVVALADTDVVYPPGWLRAIDDRLLEGEDRVVAGAVGFAPRRLWRTTILLADWSLLFLDGATETRFFNLNNVAFRRDALAEAFARVPEDYRRFGTASSLSRHFTEAGVAIALVPAMEARHSFLARSFLTEKRLRRYAHAAAVRRHEPARAPATAGELERPWTWLPLWRRWARHYQSRPAACRARLGLGPGAVALQRGLLALLSLWELALIAWVATVPGARARLAARYGW
jgi:hypothetical protein